MLRKLVKYDLKSLFKNMWIFYVGLFLLTAINFYYNNKFIGIQPMIINKISEILIVSLFVIILILMVYSIYKSILRFKINVFGDEGYLTNTLPVNKSKLYFSKFLSSLIYCTINLIACGISYLFGLCFIFTKSSCYIKSLNEMLDGVCIASNLESNIEFYSKIFKANVWVVISVFIIIIILNLICLLLSGYLGNIIGNRSNNNKSSKAKTYSFVTFMITAIIIIVVFYIVGKINPEVAILLKSNEDNIGDKYVTLRKMLWGYLLLEIIINNTLYFVGNKLLNKGINIE